MSENTDCSYLPNHLHSYFRDLRDDLPQARNVSRLQRTAVTSFKFISGLKTSRRLAVTERPLAFNRLNLAQSREQLCCDASVKERGKACVADLRSPCQTC